MATCLSGPGWLVAAVEPGFTAWSVWGRISPDELGSLLAVLAAAPSPHALYFDARRLERAGPEHLQVYRDHQARFAAAWRRVTQLACVRADGFVGALTEGFLQVLAVPFSFRTFHTPSEALQWLGRGDDPLAPELDALLARVGAEPAALLHLRTLLAGRQGKVPLAEAARHLKMSRRSLQRRLEGWQTSYRREVSAARVQVALQLLAEADMSLAEIAFTAGFTSPQRFNDAFRRLIGCAPGVWRDGRAG